MSTDRIVLVFEDRDAVANAVADRFITTISHVLEQKPFAHIVLTGGTVGISVLEKLAELLDKCPSRGADLYWQRIHLWWGDERWLQTGDPERNDTQAQAALLTKIEIPRHQVHRFPADDGLLTLDAAASAYEDELERHSLDGSPYPKFDLVLLGVGPDAHVASLFPGSDGVRTIDTAVVSVRNSPKPPPERLSLTLSTLNSADRIWLALAGEDKASALGLALAGASPIEVPAAGIEGRKRTVFFVDRDAAANVPQDLIASEY